MVLVVVSSEPGVTQRASDDDSSGCILIDDSPESRTGVDQGMREISKIRSMVVRVLSREVVCDFGLYHIRRDPGFYSVQTG